MSDYNTAFNIKDFNLDIKHNKKIDEFHKNIPSKYVAKFLYFISRGKRGRQWYEIDASGNKYFVMYD